MRASSSVGLGLLLFTLSACDKTESLPPAPPYTQIPVAQCGMTPYKLIDPSTLGDVVTSDEIALLNLDANALNSQIKSTGYTALLPVPYGSRVFRIRYTTQDRGQKVEATATVGVPANADLPAGELPMTVFLHGTTGFADACAPSRTSDGQAPAALLASLGFVAVLPDYIGMDGFGAPSTTTHGYLVGEQAAIGAWDAVRAAIKFLKTSDTGVTVGNKVVVWGGSQGGHAALFTDLYAPYYAPEFEVPAVAASVPPTALAPLADIAVTTYGPTTVAFGAVLTTMRQWYGEPADLSGVFTNDPPYNFATTLPSQIFVKDTCNTGDAYKNIGNDPSQQTPSIMFKQDFITDVQQNQLDKLTPWNCFLEQNTLASSPVKPLRHTPTFISYSEKDNLVVTAPMRQEFDHLCSLGYQLHYEECKGAGHTQGALWSLPEQLAWIHDRLDGKPLPPDMCQRHDPVCCAGTPMGMCQ